MSVAWKITVNGVDVEIEPPEGVWRSTISSGSKDAAKKIADELDRVASDRDLLSDEKKLREIIREEHGV